MTKKFLHVGCGPQTKHSLKGFNTDEWHEIRFDIDEKVNPDIVGTLTDMQAVESKSVDAVFSSHNIEHLFAHEVDGALKEFHRVLKDDGFVVLTCPDLQSVCEAVGRDQLVEPLYVAPSGPISAIDILYGHRGFIANGNKFMAHKCGFTARVLDATFDAAGFVKRAGLRRPEIYELWILALKSPREDSEILDLAAKFFP